MKKMFSLLLILLLMLTAAPAQAADAGATPNNLFNDGLAVSDGQNAYYAAYDGIYRTPLAGGTATLVVSPQKNLGFTDFDPTVVLTNGFSYLNVSDDSLYFYFEPAYAYNQYAGIYRHDLTTGQTKLLVKNHSIDYLRAQNGLITYGVYDSQHVSFRQINPDGSGDRALGLSIPGYAGSFLVEGDWVYYVDHFAPDTQNPLHPLYKIKLDGSAKTDLHSGYVYEYGGFCLDDGWLYYRQSSVQWQDGYCIIGGDNAVNGIWRMRTDGSQKSRVFASESDAIATAQAVSISGGWAYYGVESDHYDQQSRIQNAQTAYTLYKVPVTGGVPTELCILRAANGMINVNQFSLLPGWLYFTTSERRADLPWPQDGYTSNGLCDQKYCRFRAPLEPGDAQFLSQLIYNPDTVGETYTIEVGLPG